MTDLTKAIDSIYETLQGDLKATPEKVDLENLRTAYAAYEDGNEAYRDLTAHLKEIAESIDPSDPLAYAVATVTDNRVRDAVKGVRGKAAKEPTATLDDKQDARAAVVIDTLRALKQAVDTPSTFLTEILDAIDTVQVPDSADEDPGLTKKATDGLDAVTSAPTSGSGGGPAKRRDLSSVAGTKVPVYVEHGGDRVDGSMVVPPSGDQDEVTVESGGETFSSLSAFAGSVTGYSTNGWVKVRRADDGAKLDDHYPEA